MTSENAPRRPRGRTAPVLPSRAVNAVAPDNSSHDHRLVVEDLCCLRGERVLFDALAFRLDPGCAVQLEGPNGSGKTTLLRAICGLAPIEDGRIYWDGRERDARDEQFLAALTHIGDAPGVKRDLTPRENLALQRALSAAPALMADDEALSRVGLAEHADTPLRRLSSGQGRRASLARLAAVPTPLWILDEPLTALDAGGKALVEDLVGAHLARGGLCLISTHQPLEIPGGRSRRMRLGAGA
jgi:heme exporter protein A